MTQIGNIEKFKTGQPAQVNRHNATIHTVNYLNRKTKGELVINRRRTGTPIRKAFCKTAAGTGATIVCYLDADNGTEADEITVTCTLIQGTNLNACFPTLAEGTMMPVWNDGGTWRSLWWFQGHEECE